MSATGKPVGTEISVGEAIHLRNLYAGNGGYLDVCGPATCGGNKYLALTSDSNNRDNGSGTWKIHTSGGGSAQISQGRTVYLLNGYANWQGGFLDVCGRAPAHSTLAVSTSSSNNRDNGSGAWRFFKA
jgi:hypothetical protein